MSRKINVTISDPDSGIIHYEILVNDDDNQHESDTDLAYGIIEIIGKNYEYELIG